MKAHSPRALLLFWHGAAAAATQWFQMTETRQKNLHTVISRIFQIKFQQIHLSSVSGHFKCFSFKMCQNVAAIRITSQFHEFLNLILGGFSSFENTVLPSLGGSLNLVPVKKS